MSTPVSVLITTCNRAAILAETIDSILSQSHAPAEVIVVDDGSKDNTREVVARFAERVRYHLTPNGGVCLARNLAASLASSPYIAFCDDDDLWRSDKLEQQMSLHARNPSLRYSFTNFAIVSDGVWSDRTKFDDAPADFFTPSLPTGAAPLEYPHSLYNPLLSFQPIWPSTIVLERSFFQQLGGFQPELGRNPSEDLEFTLRCVREGPIGIVREPVVGVRKHTANISNDGFRLILAQIEILEYVLQHHTLSPETSALVHDQIHKRRVEAAYGAFRLADFSKVIELVRDVPSSYLDSKTRLKLFISRLPAPLARTAQKSLLKT